MGTSPHQNISEEDDSDRVLVGTLIQYTDIQNEPMVTAIPPGVKEHDLIFISSANHNVTPVTNIQQRANPFAGCFTSGGEPFVEGRPHIFRNGVFTPVNLHHHMTLGGSSNDAGNDSNMQAPISPTQPQSSLSPSSSFSELSLGTFRIVAPDMGDNDTT
ncbi:hypothetical protein SOVF_172050 [Spinacia oleracea]|nr:hypothetical protein SOVF_172050 [Spinacia oleracea]